MIDSQGRKVLEQMNAVGMILVNGLQETAEFTSFQYGGNSVIDFIWVEAREVMLAIIESGKRMRVFSEITE